MAWASGLALLMSAVVSTGCSSSRRATEPPVPATAAGTSATTALALHPSTVVTASPTTASPTTTSPTTTRPPQSHALPAPPYPVITSTVVLIDRSRPTISHGVT